MKIHCTGMGGGWQESNQLCEHWVKAREACEDVILSGMHDGLIYSTGNTPTTLTILLQCGVLLGNVGFLAFMWLCPLTCTTHPNISTVLPNGSTSSSTTLQELLRNGPKNLTMSSRHWFTHNSDPWKPKYWSEWALTHQGMETGPLGVSCDVWHHWTLPADPLSPGDCKDVSTQVGLVLGHPTHAWSDWDLGNLEWP